MLLVKIILIIFLLNAALFFFVFRHPKKRWEQEVYDCVIVCGYFANADGTPSKIMKSRVEKAVSLWKEGKVKSLVFSGGAVYNAFTEAIVMRDYALTLGAEPGHISVEDQAVSTYHNMLYSKDVMEKKGFHNCVVVTNGWHLRKADHYARKFRLNYVMCCAPDPEDQTRMQSLILAVRTAIAMHINLFKGYY